MSMFLSFVGGAAKQLTSDIEQAELDAKEMAKSSFNGLYKRYEENAVANRELASKMKAEKQYIETVWSNATPEQVNALIANPVALDAIKKAKNPETIDLKNYINVINSNDSTATGAERAAAMPEIKAQIMSKMKEAKAPEGGSPIGALIRDIGQQRMESDMEKYAKGQGMTLEQLRAGTKVTRPAETAKFDMGAIAAQPQNAKDIKDKLEVQEIQAAQKFGENSPERLAAKKQKDFVESLDVKVDKTQDARAERLMLEKLDTKDPARIKEIDTDLKGIRESIKNHKKLTTIADPKEKEATYNAMKTDVSDYVNTRMRDAKGTKWRNMVEFKTFTDDATGKTIISKTNKSDMTPEQQQEMFAAERKLTAQALKDNGYVLPDGTPRTPVAERLMRNFNITSNDLATGTPPSAKPSVEQPLPMANAPVTQPTATPAVAPTPTAKVVSVAKVQEQAKANNVPYEQAAAEARKQGYTIQ